MKTKEELQDLKNDVEDMGKKLAELSEEELKEVSGGFIKYIVPYISGELLRIENEQETVGAIGIIGGSDGPTSSL